MIVQSQVDTRCWLQYTSKTLQCYSHPSFCGRRSARVSVSRLHAPAFNALRAQRRVLWCHAGVGLFFSTSTGHTEDVAGLIKEVIEERNYPIATILPVGNIHVAQKFVCFPFC